MEAEMLMACGRGKVRSAPESTSVDSKPDLVSLLLLWRSYYQSYRLHQ
jgi:hypothetical protein